MNNINKPMILGAIAGLIIGGGGGYAIGAKTAAPSGGQNVGQNGSQFGSNRTGTNGATNRNRFGAGGGVVTGSVLSLDASSMSVKMRDGSTRVVLYSPTTQVFTSTEGKTTDVAVGKNVMVAGTQNPDGSVTASSIQIRPADMLPQGGGPGGQTTPGTGAPAQAGS